MGRKTKVSLHNIKEGKQHIILIKEITNPGEGCSSLINYNLFISVPPVIVSFNYGFLKRAVCELICFKERNIEVGNAFHILNCHIFGRHSVVYYVDGLFSQNIKIGSVKTMPHSHD